MRQSPTRIRTLRSNGPWHVDILPGGVVRIDGEGFSPLPNRRLTDNAGVCLTDVMLRSAPGTQASIVGATYAPGDGRLSGAVQAPIEPEDYDVVATNPNDFSSELADGVIVVPPPAHTAISPATAEVPAGLAAAAYDMTLTNRGF